jgi:hypothetical protein
MTEPEATAGWSFGSPDDPAAEDTGRTHRLIRLAVGSIRPGCLRPATG